MKKFGVLIVCIAILFVSACSVQETMNPQIFLERLEKNAANLDFSSSESFYEDNSFVCFIKSTSGTDFMIELDTDISGNVQKISLACTKTDKANEFILCAESIIKTYAPEDNCNEILAGVFLNGKIDNGFMYHETQWHYYTSAAYASAIYFSAESKKLSREKNTEFTLKPNDITTKGFE